MVRFVQSLYDFKRPRGKSRNSQFMLTTDRDSEWGQRILSGEKILASGAERSSNQTYKTQHKYLSVYCGMTKETSDSAMFAGTRAPGSNNNNDIAFLVGLLSTGRSAVPFHFTVSSVSVMNTFPISQKTSGSYSSFPAPFLASSATVSLPHFKPIWPGVCWLGWT